MMKSSLSVMNVVRIYIFMSACVITSAIYGRGGLYCEWMKLTCLYTTHSVPAEIVGETSSFARIRIKTLSTFMENSSEKKNVYIKDEENESTKESLMCAEPLMTKKSPTVIDRYVSICFWIHCFYTIHVHCVGVHIHVLCDFFKWVNFSPYVSWYSKSSLYNLSGNGISFL